jgi:sugar lactone lactonase YvrE
LNSLKSKLPVIFFSLACLCGPAVSAAQFITTIAGTGSAGFAGDGGPALNAQMNTPLGLCLDAAGNLYFGDYKNQRIRKISKATGIITTIAGNGSTGFSGDGGPALNASMNEPSNLCFDKARNFLYFTDYWNTRVRRIDISTGIISTVAGDGTENYINGGLAKTSGLLPGGIALDAVGNLFIAQHPAPLVNYTSNIISRVDILTGIITTVAGNGQYAFAGDGGPALNASLLNPMDVAVDAAGNIYVADCINQRIRKIDKATGIITTIAGDGKNTFPSPDGGQATATSLKNPIGVSMSNDGNLIIVDQADLKVRLLNLSTGIISTLAGNSYLGRGPDCVEATTETLADLNAAVMDPAGNLYFNDQLYNRIRMVFAANAIPTINISADAKSICTGTPVTFSTTVTNGSPDNTYQWMVNDIPTGATGTTYPTSSLKNNDRVICRLQYAPYTSCPDYSVVNSNPIIITVSPPVTPAINIAADDTDICSGSTVTFTATASNGGSLPQYQWLVNGAASGNNSNSFTSNQLADQDEISCILRADPDQGCLVSVNAVSNAIRMKVNIFPAPSVIINGGEQKICPEDSITFAATPKDAGPDPTYQWQVNGIASGDAGPVFTAHDLNDGDQVSCLLLAKNAACAAGIPVVSKTENI